MRIPPGTKNSTLLGIDNGKKGRARAEALFLLLKVRSKSVKLCMSGALKNLPLALFQRALRTRELSGFSSRGN
jgi:hypothetical protein